MSKNDITGDDISTGAASEAFRGNFDAIFNPSIIKDLRRQIKELEEALLEQVDLTIKLRDTPCPHCGKDK